MKPVARVASHGPSHGTRLRLILLCGGTGVALVLVLCPTARVEASNPQKCFLVNTPSVCVFGGFRCQQASVSTQPFVVLVSVFLPSIPSLSMQFHD